MTTSVSQRLAKISAGFLGGYMVTISLHVALAYWVNHVNVLMTLRYAGFLLWCVLFLLAFLVKNGWKIWGVYLLLTFLFSVGIYLGKAYGLAG
ncbi:hypothetical protein [Sinomicrobium sp. M5D2P17]